MNRLRIVNMMELQPPRVLGEKVWCPRCGEYVKVIRVAGAAKIIDVDRRTVYNYIKRKKVFAIRVAGSTLRVCSSCLVRENDLGYVEGPDRWEAVTTKRTFRSRVNSLRGLVANDSVKESPTCRSLQHSFGAYIVQR
jgi:hypothetical protein